MIQVRPVPHGIIYLELEGSQPAFSALKSGYHSLVSCPSGRVIPRNSSRVNFFLASSFSHRCNCLPFINSRRVGRNGLINGSLRTFGGKSDVVLMIPFDVLRSPLMTPTSARTSS